MYQQQQQAMQAQYQQQQAYDDYLRQQQMMYAQQQAQQQQQQPIQAQPTGFGANNPFAAFAAPPPSSSPAPPPPQQQQQQTGFESSFQPAPAPAPAPEPQQPQRTGGGTRYKATGDEKHGELARMLAGGRESGVDTFGNVGSARVPVWQQKTGQQVQQGVGPMQPQQTGLAKPLNPFGSVTGNYQAPTQFNQPTGYGQQQQQQQQQKQDVRLLFSLSPKKRSLRALH